MGKDSIESSLKHEQLKEIIRMSVISGDFKPGDGIPSQKEMCEIYNLSTSTVREAITSLVHEGLLYRIQGRGTFVADRKREHVTIGLVLPHLSRDGDIEYSLGPDLMPSLVHFIGEEAKKNFAHMLLCLDNDDIKEERENLNSLIDRKVDGIIVYYIGDEQNTECLRNAKNAGIPTCLIDNYSSSVDTDYVVTDNFRGAYRVVEQLVEKGFKNILYFSPDVASTAIHERFAGYRAAVSNFGIPEEVILVKGAESSEIPMVEEATYQSVREQLNGRSGPVAVFTLNAVMLPGAFRAVEDIRFAYDQVALASFENPHVTFPDEIIRVHAIQPIEEIGRKSVQIIMDKLTSNCDSQHLVLEPDIRIGSGVNAVERA